MISDDAKVGLFEWLFGKSSLDKAAKQGNTPPPNVQPTAPADNDYVRKQIEATNKQPPVSQAPMAAPAPKSIPKKAVKPAMDKLQKDQYY